MYAYIEGRLAQLDPTYAVLDAGGVGYLLRIPLTTYEAFESSQERDCQAFYASACD